MVDFIRQGVRSTSDGNTARIVFSRTDIVAAITNIDVENLNRYSTILQVKLIKYYNIIIPIISNIHLLSHIIFNKFLDTFLFFLSTLFIIY